MCKTMKKVRKLFRESGLTQQALGEMMDYPPGSARKSVSRFLRSEDPRVGTLRRFARAMRVKMEELL